MFLSLVLLIILALLCTIIEGSRVSTAKVYARRALTTAMDSALAEYYAPLWNEYHIFGLYTGSDDYKINNAQLTQTITDYMEYTLNPSRDLGGVSSAKGMNMLDIHIDKLSLQNQTKLMDYEGELFINEAVEYMKYEEIGAGLEQLLGKLSLLEQPSKVSYIMEEKHKVVEELVEIDKEILKLMELYDGLMTSEKGTRLDKDGALKTTTSFIKKICYTDITMDNVGINNESIYLVQKDKFINPSTLYFTGIRNAFMQIEDINRRINELQSDIAELKAQISICEAELSKINSKEVKTDEDKKAAKRLKKDIKAYSDNIKALYMQITEEYSLIKTQKTTISQLGDSLNQLIDELIPLPDEAISSINNIVDKTNMAAPLINGYETMLKGSKEGLSKELYEGLEEELNQLKKYTGADNNSYDFPGMLKILDSNKQVLMETQLVLKNAQEVLEGEGYAAAADLYTAANNSLMRYQLKGLTLDYSTLVYDKDKRKENLDKVNDALASGLTSLVVNPKDVSEAKLLITDDLPSHIHALTDEKTDYSDIIASFFQKSTVGDKNSGLGELFNEFQTGASVKDIITMGLNSLAGMVLFREYLDKHFESYQPKAKPPKAQKPSSLLYEQEYLIAGKPSDAGNLNVVVSRILFLRMIFDFISVLSDSSIRNEAKLIAAALVGFTGLPILVFLTQMLILILWAFAEALLDTSALMMGKDVPVIKKKLIMTFPDIFMLTREQLSKKAASLPNTKELTINYNNYIKLFLLMTGKERLAFRSMDLVQENLKLRYEADDFKIKNCLFGIEISAQFSILSKLTAISFVQKQLNSNQESFQYITSAADSY